jgi:hypothetical protein
VTYPHDDEKCRKNSVDADGFRSLSRQVAEMVTPNMGPVIVPEELSPDDGTRHYSVRHHEVPVQIVPDLPGLGENRLNHDWSRTIRLREDGDQQVLLHETLHAILDRMLFASPYRLGLNHGDLGHRIINQIEVGLWESGWRRMGHEVSRDDPHRAAMATAWDEGWLAGAEDEHQDRATTANPYRNSEEASRG